MASATSTVNDAYFSSLRDYRASLFSLRTSCCGRNVAADNWKHRRRSQRARLGRFTAEVSDLALLRSTRSTTTALPSTSMNAEPRTQPSRPYWTPRISPMDVSNEVHGKSQSQSVDATPSSVGTGRGWPDC